MWEQGRTAGPPALAGREESGGASPQPSVSPSSAGADGGGGLPLQLDAPSLLSQPSFILAGTSAIVPSPPSYHKPLVPHHPVAAGSLASAVAAREDPTPSTSTSRPSAPAAFHMRIAPAPSKQAGQRGAAPEASDGLAPAIRHGSGVGLALFGIGLVNKALFQTLMEENNCCLLYVVEDQLEEVESAFGAEFLAGTRVLRQQDADIALNDQRYCPPLTPVRAASFPPALWRVSLCEACFHSGKRHRTVVDPDCACLAPCVFRDFGTGRDQGAVAG